MGKEAKPRSARPPRPERRRAGFTLIEIMAVVVIIGLLSTIVGAVVFSAVHYVGALGDVFTWPSFTFRFLFGLALNALFLVRGFGVAAWTHALYDVMVVTHLLG